MSKKQQLAQMRNSAKWRLTGIAFPIHGLTIEEKELIDQIKGLKNRLLEEKNWNRNTKKLGLNVGPRYKVTSTTGPSLITTSKKEAMTFEEFGYTVKKIE